MNKAINISIGAGLVIVVCLTVIIIFDPFNWIGQDDAGVESYFTNKNAILDGNSGLIDEDKELTPYDKLMISAIKEIDRKNFYEALTLLAEADIYTEKNNLKEDIEEKYNQTLINLAKQDEQKGISRDYSNLLLDNRRAIREGKIYDDIDRTVNSAIFRAEALNQYAEALDLLFIADQMYPNPKQQIMISNLFSSVLDKLREKDKKQNIKREYLTLSERRKNIEDTIYDDMKDIYQENPLVEGELDNEDTLLAKVEEHKDITSKKPDDSGKQKSESNNNSNKNTRTDIDSENQSTKTKINETKIDNSDDKTDIEKEDNAGIDLTNNVKKKTNMDSLEDVDRAIIDRNYDEASDYLESRYSDGLNDEETLLKLIEVYSLMGKLNETEKYVQEIINSNKIDNKNIKSIANLYYNEGLTEIAYNLYNKYINDQPYEYDVLYRMSHIELANKQVDTAMKHLMTIISHKAGLNKEIFKKAYYLMGLAFEMKDSPMDAIGYYNQAIKIDNKYINPMLQIANIYYKLGNNKIGISQYEKARDLLRDILKIDPENYNAVLLMGKTAEKLTNIEEAITYYRKASRLKPQEYPPKALLADALLSIGRINEAISQFEISLSINHESENNPVLMLEYGQALMKAGRYKDSINIYEKALKNGAKKDIVYKGLAEVYFLMNDYQMSISYLEKAIEVNKSNVNYYINLAINYNILGNYDEAEYFYQKALSMDEDNSFVKEELAHLYITKGELEKGIKIIEKMINNNNKNADLLFLLGNAYLKSERKNEAIDIYKELILEYPDYNNTKVVKEQLELLSQ
jgi:tetratricopeptide (TPR) repeat protein